MEPTSENFTALLEQYRSIWNNRLLETNERNSEETLKEAIRRELLDENSHPRIRKNRFEKYYSAIARIISSQVRDEMKIRLIKLHNTIMAELGEESK